MSHIVVELVSSHFRLSKDNRVKRVSIRDENNYVLRDLPDGVFLEEERKAVISLRRVELSSLITRQPFVEELSDTIAHEVLHGGVLEGNCDQQHYALKRIGLGD
jgi:hypothetical protein